jgi:hypothetical protein
MERHTISQANAGSSSNQLQVPRNTKLKGILVQFNSSAPNEASISITRNAFANALATGSEQFSRDFGFFILSERGATAESSFNTFIPCNDNLAQGEYIYVHAVASSPDLSYRITLLCE